MTDVITNLCNKRAKVYRARKAFDEEFHKNMDDMAATMKKYEQESRDRLAGFDRELNACADAMSRLNAMAQSHLCPVCGGEGVIKKDGPNGPVTETCDACVGTGINLGTAD